MTYDLAIWRLDDRFSGLPRPAEFEARATESEQRVDSGSNLPPCPEMLGFCRQLRQMATSRGMPMWEGPLSGDLCSLVTHDFLYLNLTRHCDDDDLDAIVTAAESASLAVYDTQCEELITSP